MTDKPPEILSADDVAELFGMNVQMVRKVAREVVKPGGPLLIVDNLADNEFSASPRGTGSLTLASSPDFEEFKR